MRISKQRRARKHMNFYRSVYGFKPPYKVVVDGTALQVAECAQTCAQNRIQHRMGLSFPDGSLLQMGSWTAACLS